MELSEALFSLVHTVRNNMQQELKQLTSDLSPMHLKSLKVISIIDDCTGQKLADFMGRDKAQINRLIKELVSQEFIIKSENKQDKRSQILTLSETGLKVMMQFQCAEKRVFDKMIADIPKAQIESFILLTQTLKNNLG
ncbi:MarR family winged helix-turn-helix transcriptional regulator [Thalassotalea sp. PLHSN55]|uniref:MarR family winged helix-turn-helix transcriptional regulator n=1 Tax=Thalassotalea sp. PLHSN55 TaxID=3435888 RepID=UPI003F84B3F2